MKSSISVLEYMPTSPPFIMKFHPCQVFQPSPLELQNASHAWWLLGVVSNAGAVMPMASWATGTPTSKNSLRMCSLGQVMVVSVQVTTKIMLELARSMA